MFGYVITNPESLSKERQQRFRAFYCGLCATLRRRHGLASGAALSYDMTFLAMLLNAVYEPGERSGRERCPAHLVKAHDYVLTPVMDYAADMNAALAYHKCRDNWSDDRDLIAAGEGALLKRAYQKAKANHPEKCAAIEAWLDEIHDIEARGLQQVDAPVNATGRLLGELFVWPGDAAFSDELRAVGDGLGRFIYFMDAYEDLPRDARKGRYNPLKGLRDREDYEALCKTALTMMIADATQAFEELPVVLDADILRNVLYSGIWSKYALLQKKRGAQGKGAE